MLERRPEHGQMLAHFQYAGYATDLGNRGDIFQKQAKKAEFGL